MGVTIGTNSGFVTSAPTADPGAFVSTTIDNTGWVTRDTSPAAAIKIKEIGWWCADATEAGNWRGALYAADGAVVPGEAGTRLYLTANQAKGTTSGWKSVAVDWSISPSTAYWIGVGVDNVATTTTCRYAMIGGSGFDTKNAGAAMSNPFGGGALVGAAYCAAIYVIWEAATPGIKINIGDVWKDVTGVQINIGDTWKTVTKGEVNIGDVWKTFFGS